MADFFHGVKLVEISDGISQVQVSSSSVIGVIGTSPDAKDEDFPFAGVDNRIASRGGEVG